MGRSGWVKLIGEGWMIYLSGGWMCACRSRGGYGQVWADMGKGGKGGHVWMGQTDGAGMDDMGSGWVWVCVQV